MQEEHLTKISMMDLRKQPGEFIERILRNREGFAITRQRGPKCKPKIVAWLLPVGARVGRPTIEELDAILNSKDELRVQVRPDGSCEAVPVERN